MKTQADPIIATNGTTPLTVRQDWQKYYKGRSPASLVRASEKPSLIDRFIRGRSGRVFELGCGGSKVLVRCAAQGWQVGGIDYYEPAINVLRASLEGNGHSAEGLLLGDFLEADCTSLRGSADLLVSFGVVEHFDDAWRILNKWKCVLKEGGLVVTSVPNMHSINAAPFLWLDRAYWAQHVAYTPEALDRLHTKAGLCVVEKAAYIGKYSLDMLTPWDIIARKLRNRYLFKVVHAVIRLCIEKPLGLFSERGLRRLSPHVMGVYSFGHEAVPMSDPLVSVIIPAFNAAPYLMETLESVFAQTYQHFEVIVVDDGSTDGTAEILDSYGDRITVTRQPHAGNVALARNAAIRQARGEYIACLDADDVWLPDKLEQQVAIMKESSCSLVGSASRARLPQDGQARTVTIDDLLLRNRFVASSVMMKRSCLDAVGVFDEDPGLVAVEDWDLWLRIAACAPVLLMGREVVRIRHVFGSLSCCQNYARMYKAERYLLAKHREQYAELRRSSRTWARATAACHYRAGIAVLQLGRYGRAAWHMLRALGVSPCALFALWRGRDLPPPENRQDRNR